MQSQKTAFLASEGDAYFDRNPKQINCEEEPIIFAMNNLGMKPSSVLEIGSSSGSRLNCIQKLFGAECYGIDPSAKAVEYGRTHHPKINLSCGSADNLTFPNDRFDLVIFGFCLYLCDPQDYFRIAQETDRVLRDKGFLIIKDFTSPVPMRGTYSHLPGIFSHKLDWASMFTWNPAYRLISRSYLEPAQKSMAASDAYSFHPQEQMALDVLRKDTDKAFISNPYGAPVAAL